MAGAYERRAKQIVEPFLYEKDYRGSAGYGNCLYNKEGRRVGWPDMVLYNQFPLPLPPTNPAVVVEIERPKTWEKGLIQVWHYSKFAQRALFVTSLKYFRPTDFKRLRSFCIDHEISLIDVSHGTCRVVLNYID